MKRNYFIFVISIFTLLGSISAALATGEIRDYQLRGYVDATHDPNLPYAIPRLGVNVELTQYSDDQLKTNLKQIQDSGFIWIRQFFLWDEIEPTKGHFDWERWDLIVNAIAQNPNLRLVAVITHSPSWARANQSVFDPTAPPDDIQAFADFLRMFANRYSNTIDVYQIWDEPNIRLAWGNNDPHAAHYTAMLCAAFPTIHAADENSTVIAAALAPTAEMGPSNISDIQYLKDMYVLGAKNCMDAVAAKPYGFSSSPDDRTFQPDILNFSRIIALREVMIANGDAQKALWASNWGWNSLPLQWTGQPSIWGNVTSSLAVDYTNDAIVRANREWPWLGGMILHHWQPDAPPNDPIWGFALINQDDEPNNLLNALQTWQHPPLAQNGLYHPVTPYAHYSGVWTFGALGADIGWLETSDSQLKFDFKGQDIALLLREDDYVAFLYPTVDGKPANDTPQDNQGNAYIFLRSAGLTPEINLVPVAKNLSDTQHSLHIKTDKGWDRWALAGFAVSSGNLADPYNSQINIAWLTAIVALVSVVLTGRAIEWYRAFSRLRNLIDVLEATSNLAFSTFTSIVLLMGMLLTWGDGTLNILRRDSVPLAIAIFTAGLIYIQPPLILVLVSALILFIIFYNHIDIGLTLTLFWSPFFLFPVELFHYAFPLAETLILLTFGAWFLKQVAIVGRGYQSTNSAFHPLSISTHLSHLHAIDIGLLVWIGIAILSLTWTNRLDVAYTELRTLFIEPLLFYLILRTIPLDKQIIVRLIDALIIAGVIIALLGFITPFITAEEGTRRLASVYGSPNNVGLFLGRCIPFSTAYLLVNTGKKRRAWGGITSLIMVIAVLLTQSVGAIVIGLPAAIVVVTLALWGKQARLPIIGLSILGIGILTVLTQLSARFSGLFDFTRGTNFFRLRVWESALNIIRDHPITGIGLDQFLYAFRGHYIRPDAVWDKDLSHPHNFVLDIWTRLGVIGVFTFFGLQFAFWSRLKRLLRQHREYDCLYFALGVGLAGAMADTLAHGLVDNSIFVNDLSYIFMLCLGLIITLENVRAIDLKQS